MQSAARARRAMQASISDNPEPGRRINAGEIDTNLHDIGDGPPVLLIHGSGPGVTAWANWRLTLPALAANHRVIAPDLVGFGFTSVPEGTAWRLKTWLNHVLAVLDALQIPQAHVVGNSFGGAVALALATRHPDRVSKLVLMGSAGVKFALTPGLDAVWGYQPSLAAMRGLLDIFAYDRALVTDELAELRYRASLRPGAQDHFAAMFPAPRQRAVDMLASPEDAIRAIGKPTLIIHGRDDKVIPLSNALTLLDWIMPSELHVFGRCGHWVQIEHADSFNAIVQRFLDA